MVSERSERAEGRADQGSASAFTAGGASREQAAAAAENIERLRVYAAFQNAIFWLPVFFLYFSSHFSLAEVLRLEALYYLFNVVLEVPSGYFSDRWGRRRTLILASASSALGALLFASGSTFGVFVLGQLAFAASFAFVSGTDTALLYDSLVAAGRAGLALGKGEPTEVAAREAELQSAQLYALAFAALVGGLLAGFDLRLAYLATALAAAGAVLVARRLFEPPRCYAAPPLRQLVDVGRQVRQPLLAWIAVFAIGMRVFSHVPYELLQPYVGLVLRGSEDAAYRSTPAAAGLMMALSMGISAWFSGRAVGLHSLLGVRGALLLSLALQALVIVSMARWLHPLVLLLLTLRSVPLALMRPIVNAAIHPRIPGSLRATYFSVQNLAGSLAFSATLVIAARCGEGSPDLTPSLLSRIAGGYAVGAVLLFALLGIWALRARSE